MRERETIGESSIREEATKIDGFLGCDVGVEIFADTLTRHVDTEKVGNSIEESLRIKS